MIPITLRHIAQSLPRPLYIVGGWTRDVVSLIASRNEAVFDEPSLNAAVATGALKRYLYMDESYKPVHHRMSVTAVSDIDVCGDMSADELRAYLPVGMTLRSINPRVGTQLICAGAETYEYTPFRAEEYGADGSHTPTGVTFVKELKTDALRRDFCCNSIYFNLKNNAFADPLGGIPDAIARVLRVVDPVNTLKFDGLRIMRLARFAVTKNMRIHPKTFRLAAANVANLAAISKERVYKELLGILAAPEGGAYRGIRILADLGAIEYCLGKQNADSVIPDVSIEFQRLKSVKQETFTAFIGDCADGDPARARILCELLRAPSIVTARTAALLGCCQRAKTERADFVAADFFAYRGDVNELLSEPIRGQLVEAWDRIERLELPVSIKDLKIGGRDVMDVRPDVSVRRISGFLQAFVYYCIDQGIRNNRDVLLRELPHFSYAAE